MGPERDMSQPSGEFPPPDHAYPAYPAHPRAPRPPLTKRLRTTHWIAIDCAVGAVLTLISLTAGLHPARAYGGSVGGSSAPVAVVLLAGVFLPVALRRKAPVTAFGALLILAVLMSNVAVVLPAVLLLAAAYVLYTVTVTTSKRSGLAALGLVLALMVVISATTTEHSHIGTATSLVPVALANVITWMTGYSVRQRRLYLVSLQDQAASSAVTQERLRIARELHDIVAHSMSVIAVQAGYGQYVMDISPDGAREALGAIQATSRDALEEMRRMLGVLRQQDVTGVPLVQSPAAATPLPMASSAAVLGTSVNATGHGHAEPAPLAPAPGLASLDRLVQRTCGAGVQVELKVTGEPCPVPAGVDLSAYRIIQEALTNVVKHAGTGAHCTVSLVYTAAVLDIRVTDDGARSMVPAPASTFNSSPVTPGTGHGIIGMRERAHLCGGSFSAAPLAGGGFLVTVTLPLPAEDLDPGYAEGTR